AANRMTCGAARSPLASAPQASRWALAAPAPRAATPPRRYPKLAALHVDFALPLIASSASAQSIRPDALEPPREIGLDRMIARVVRELTDIGNADLRLRAQLQIAARFDERGVARDRDAQDAERRAGALERKQRARRHRAKGVLPRERRAWDQRHAVRHEVSAGPARAERGVVDIVLGARGAERAHAAGFVEALGVQIHPGEASEWLDRKVAEAHAVTDLAEHLALDGAVA